MREYVQRLRAQIIKLYGPSLVSASLSKPTYRTICEFQEVATLPLPTTPISFVHVYVPTAGSPATHEITFAQIEFFVAITLFVRARAFNLGRRPYDPALG